MIANALHEPPLAAEILSVQTPRRILATRRGRELPLSDPRTCEANLTRQQVLKHTVARIPSTASRLPFPAR
jgi:hypothetical protein